MDARNKYILDALGVLAWHDAGYTGTGVHIASVENFQSAGDNAHERLTYLACKEVAPNAEYYYLPQARNGTEGKELSETAFHARLVGEVERNDISVWFGSRSTSRDPQLDKALDTVPRLTVLFSAGNTGDGGGSKFIDGNNVYGVGAVNISWSYSVGGVPAEGAEMMILPAFYSSESDAVDFAAPTDLYINDSRFDGTSCATPVLAGMCALINEFFIERTGYPLTRGKMYDFLFDNCVKIGGAARTKKSGWGMPILPPIESIDIQKYAGETTMFSDIQNHWAKDYIEKCARLGIVNGYEDGRFRPNEAISRAEVCTIIAKLADKMGVKK